MALEGHMFEKMFTIGVYGTTEAAFYDALCKANVDTFCDIRLHRGMRGSRYAYVNSAYLQNRLSKMGIRYVHIKELAPSKKIREMQKEYDKLTGAAKQTRTVLGKIFIDEFRKSNLETFDFQFFLNMLPSDTKTMVFFCVERAPDACHRSLVTDHLSKIFSIYSTDITP
jgi:uncharacterized protein (DUF488 family)